MAVDETTTWDVPGIDPALWRAMEEIERQQERIGSRVRPDQIADGEIDTVYLADLHTHWPALAAAVRSLAGRVLDLEQQERQRAVALEGLREENERLQGQRDALRETAMLIVHGPHGGPKLRSNLAALLRVAQACDAALAEGSGDDDA